MRHTESSQPRSSLPCCANDRGKCAHAPASVDCASIQGRCDMPRREILDRIQKYVEPFRVTKGKGFRLKDFDPGDTCGLKMDKGDAAELLHAALPGSRKSRTCFT